MVEHSLFERVVKRMDSEYQLLRAWPLAGGVSAQVIVLEVSQSDGRTKRMVLRRHGDADLQQNPQVAADEFRLLRILKSEGLPVPLPIHLDASGDIFSTPYVVMEWLDGKSEFSPSDLTDFIRQVATHLAKIHQVDTAKQTLSFLPKQANLCSQKLKERPAVLDDSLNERLIRDVLESVWPLPHKNQDVLLHGDFWPGNLLWKDGQLMGVIDWEDALLGDPIADLANGRLEILWAFGMQAMADFTHEYQSLMRTLDVEHLPYWDLYAALRPASQMSKWGLDKMTEITMRDWHQWFVTQALQNISSSRSDARL